MANSENPSSGIESTMGAMGGMLPGAMGQLAQASQSMSDPKGMIKGAGKNISKKIAKKVLKKTAEKIAQKLAFSPHFWIGVAIVLGIITWVAIFMIIITAITGGSNGGTSPSSQPGPPPNIYTFVALGDSLTAWPNQPTSPKTLCDRTGKNCSINGVGAPWPSQLATNDQSLSLLKNAGVPAETTTQILARFNNDVAANRPEVLFLQGGTNDSGKGIDTIGNLKQIISKAQSSGIKKIVILTIAHQCPTGSFTALNNQIKGLASSSVAIIDINNVLKCGNDYQADGLHFTDAGAKAVADYIDAQIKAQNFLPTKSPTGDNAFHFYCQYASVYNTNKSVCDLQHFGCGVTSTAMILTSFGDIYSPKELGVKYGFGCERATFPKDVTSTLSSLGYVHQNIYIPSSGAINVNTVRSLTNNGFYVITGACITCRGCRGPTSHTTVITKVNDDNTFVDADPTYCTSDTNYDMRTLNPVYPGPDVKNTCSNGGGWYWAYAVKKQ